MWHCQNIHQKRAYYHLRVKQTSSSIILLVTNQSGTNFNADRKSSTVLLHISWVLCLSWQYVNLKGSSETILSHICWVLCWLRTESNTRISLNSFITHLLSLTLIRKLFYCRSISINSFITDFLRHSGRNSNAWG